MSSIRPLQWIEQAEARQVMTDALFRQAPTASRRQHARDAIMETLANVFCRIMPEGPTPQMRPVLAHRQDPRQSVRYRDDPYR